MISLSARDTFKICLGYIYRVPLYILRVARSVLCVDHFFSLYIVLGVRYLYAYICSLKETKRRDADVHIPQGGGHGCRPVRWAVFCANRESEQLDNAEFLLLLGMITFMKRSLRMRPNVGRIN